MAMSVCVVSSGRFAPHYSKNLVIMVNITKILEPCFGSRVKLLLTTSPARSLLFSIRAELFSIHAELFPLPFSQGETATYPTATKNICRLTVLKASPFCSIV